MESDDLCVVVGRAFCSADAINDLGQVVGAIDRPNSLVGIGVLWDAADINNRGPIVSINQEDHGTADRAFLWTHVPP